LPNVFIPIAERFGLIGHIGNWVIEESCRQSRQWRDKGLRMRVAINLSAHQMRQDDIVERITGALQTHKIHPSLLTCEITESAAMEDTKTTQTTFRRLGELGTHLSIDDFGTGYSSLSYLRKLPAEELKIDRSFIMDLEHSADARAVVDAVIKLAHALGLKVVAEGVENQRQQQILVQMQCDELQGFLFAKPMSGRALLLWAINDRGESAIFKQSLFDETRQSERA
jgi:EAL domain-containing protein (putative c-di-GMP-specific phosphodiesterase class I)